MLASLFWIRWPRAIVRRFPGLWGTAGDGHFLCGVPPLAALAPVAALLAGLVVGAAQLGFEDVYTESIPLMAAVIALGVFSAQLGGLAVVGFAVGELVLADRTLALHATILGPDGPFSSGLIGQVARVWLPLLITYLLLAAAVIVLPRTARILVAAVGRWKRVPAGLAWPLASGLYATVVWVGIRTWVAAAPILVRPRYTWLDSLPTAEAIQPLQGRGSVLVAAGVAAAILRQILIGVTLVPNVLQRRVRWVEQTGPAQGAVGPHRPRPSQRLVADVFSAVLATLVLAGVLEHPWLWVLSLVVMVSVRVLRSGVVASDPLDRWKRLVDRVPAAVRLGLLWLLARLVTDALSNGTIGSYTGVALFVLGGVVTVFAVFPGSPAGPAERDDAAVPAVPADPVGPGSSGEPAESPSGAP
ncbi:MAG TPA: hypothetical protein VM942_10900 [Acidimicrobiales bacterium]|nr:hypothetical protein [Acidimicrobiales bacterium]